ncbi:glycosyltransferase [Microbacterium sp. USHLN186]|uniref:glycosyltransferase n=1 Tax=Microbacterium sp. USHLN186 TaxID=3081286 RepID=UPI00301863EC
MTAPTGGRTALVLSYSEIKTDPRVRREIDWLVGNGWTVDTLGLGAHPAADVRRHFPLGRAPGWTRGRLGTLITHTLIPPRTRFRMLVSETIPVELRQAVRAGDYDLVVFNEIEFAPWLEDRRDFGAAPSGRFHLDLHEYRNPDIRRRTLGGRITGAHYRWVRSHIGSARFTSRSAVNTPIGRLYAEEFGIPTPAQVRNAPPYVSDIEPLPVRDGRIRLLFHGMPSWARGFTEILEALESLPAHFTMTFMLMPNPAVIDKLRAAIDRHPARDRIEIVPPAQMRRIAQEINEYDVEVVFYKPLEPNLEFAMPNKFFEAAQGRLAVIVGETPTMAPIVRQYRHGAVVPEFTSQSLRDTLAALTPETVTQMKRNAAVVAQTLNAESEGQSFLAAIASGLTEGTTS